MKTKEELKRKKREKIKQLEHLREDWFSLIGYEKYINESIKNEIEKIENERNSLR